MVSKKAAATDGDKAPDGSLDALQHQFETLRADIAALSATVLTIAAAEKDEAVATGMDRGTSALHQAEEGVGALLQDMGKKVRAKPFTALAMSAALGLVFGLCTAKRR